MAKNASAPYKSVSFQRPVRSLSTLRLSRPSQINTAVGVGILRVHRMCRYGRIYQNNQALGAVTLNQLNNRSQRPQKVACVRNSSTTADVCGRDRNQTEFSIYPRQSALVRFSRPHTVVGTTVLQFQISSSILICEHIDKRVLYDVSGCC